MITERNSPQPVAKGITALCIFSLIFFSLHAQVPVVQEPRHPVKISNDYIRLIEVHLQPKDTTQYHIHATPSAIIMLSQAGIGINLINAPATSSKPMPGDNSYAPYGEHPITHRVWNEGNTVFHVLDIELLEHDTTKSEFSKALFTSAKLNWEHHFTRCYSISLSSNQKLEFEKTTCGYLVVDISGNTRLLGRDKGNINANVLVAETYHWFPPGINFYLAPESGKKSSLVILEIK